MTRKFGGSRPNCDCWSSWLVLRDGVERSRRFVMLPSFGLSLPGLDWLSSHSWILLCDASPLELFEELDCPEDSTDRGS